MTENEKKNLRDLAADLAAAEQGAYKRNRGWTPAGATYAQRDVIRAPERKEESNG